MIPCAPLDAHFHAMPIAETGETPGNVVIRMTFNKEYEGRGSVIETPGTADDINGPNKRLSVVKMPLTSVAWMVFQYSTLGVEKR